MTPALAMRMSRRVCCERNVSAAARTLARSAMSQRRKVVLGLLSPVQAAMTSAAAASSRPVK